MRSYSEDEISRAFLAIGVRWNTLSGQLISKLRDMQEAHVHDFADTDTITVREVRDAWERVRGPGTPDLLFRDISEHREPEYPAGTAWEDRNHTTHWYRLANGKWYRFGSSTTFEDHVPVRPLRRMKADE
jgi:hypothetical protein